jgi:hypothetical protein
MKIRERQGVCIELIGKFPRRFVLIGGYATSAFDFPRFSVDLDLVVRGKDVREFRELLEVEGFKLVQEASGFSEVYEGKFMRFEKKVDSLPVSVDLLVDMVQSRQTGAAYSFDYLWKNSEVRKVVGSGVRESAEVRVADREMLIALKINSMRRADQRDIISLCGETLDSSKVLKHLERAPRDRVLSHIDVVLEALGDPKGRDSIKGVFGISDDVYGKVFEKARRELSLVKEGVASKSKIGK